MSTPSLEWWKRNGGAVATVAALTAGPLLMLACELFGWDFQAVIEWLTITFGE